jgi:hypothetical protein
MHTHILFGSLMKRDRLEDLNVNKMVILEWKKIGYEKVDCIKLIQIGAQWRAVLKTIVNLRVRKSWEFICWIAFNFSRKPCILEPATEHSYFVASWWHTPIRHPPKVTRFDFQQTSDIHSSVGKRKGCSLSCRSPVPIKDSFHVATMARKQNVKFTRN